MISALPLLLCLLSATPFEAVSTDNLDAYIEQVLKARKACGPTSVWYCLRRLGHSVKLQEVWDEAPIGKDGIRGSDLLSLLHSHGVPAQALRGDPTRLDALPVPAILIIDDKHCVVYEGLDPETNSVRYFEPSLGEMRSVPREEMQQHWSGEVILFQQPQLSMMGFGAIAFLGFASVLITAMALRWCWLRLRQLRSSCMKTLMP